MPSACARTPHNRRRSPHEMSLASAMLSARRPVSREKYMKKFGSAKCANHIPFKYSDLLIERYKHEWSYMPR